MRATYNALFQHSPVEGGGWVGDARSLVYQEKQRILLLLYHRQPRKTTNDEPKIIGWQQQNIISYNINKADKNRKKLDFHLRLHFKEEDSDTIASPVNNNSLE